MMANKQSTAQTPEFALRDTLGRIVQLSDYRGDRHVVLVFNRSLY
jgi:peroxiredoxin